MRVIRPVTDEELFDHQVRTWTAGELRSALDGVPDVAMYVSFDATYRSVADPAVDHLDAFCR